MEINKNAIQINSQILEFYLGGDAKQLFICKKELPEEYEDQAGINGNMSEKRGYELKRL